MAAVISSLPRPRPCAASLSIRHGIRAGSSAKEAAVESTSTSILIGMGPDGTLVLRGMLDTSQELRRLVGEYRLDVIRVNLTFEDSGLFSIEEFEQ
jgi:hypothetical protein